MPNPFIVVLDPGHGGQTLADHSTPNNAISPNGLMEKDLTLSLALAAQRRLPAHVYQVLLTRQEDVNLPLAERAQAARQAGAQAFISIHLNGHPDPSVDGTEVYLSPAARANDRRLAQALLMTVPMATGVPARGLKTGNFIVLSGEHHLPATAACLLEVAYMTNPSQARRLESRQYIEQLGLAIAQGVMSYAATRVSAQALNDVSPAGEQVIYSQERAHADPPNFPINLPEPGKGSDSHTFDVPAGLLFSRWQMEVLADSPGAGYQVKNSPPAGAQGANQIQVEWWHLPYGRIKYRLTVYASPDGSAAPEPVSVDGPGWQARAKDQIQQGIPLSLAVHGENARRIYSAMRQRQAQEREPVVEAQEPITIFTVVLVLGVIAAIVIALGMLVFGALLYNAMEKGYDVKDTQYSAAAGSGETRQEHTLLFNLIKRPAGAAPAV
jgi:N-acetylmuramoyl-L-alanine amidase